MFITLSVVYIQISNTCLPEFPNILLYVEANPVWMRRLYSAVIFSSKLDYSYRSTNVLKAFFSAMHAVWSLSEADPGVFVGGGSLLRNGVIDWWRKQILIGNTKKKAFD